LSSNTLDIKNSNALTIDVWVWETNLTGPLGKYNMVSGFTSNIITNASVVESTYVSATDFGFGTGSTPTPTAFSGTLLASQLFTNPSTTPIDGGFDSYTDTTPNFTGLYSEAQEYQITFNTGGGEVNATIATYDAPEPASMAMLGVGMIGIGAVRRKRRAPSSSMTA
jgi:PEP-CTERM motif